MLIHFLAFAAFGASTGLAAMALISLLSGGFRSDVLGQPYAVAVMGACAVSVSCGWSWTVWQSGKDMSQPR